MQRFGDRSKLTLATLLAISLVAPLAIWLLAPWQPSSWLANRLHAEMEQATEGQVDLSAAQLASLGPAGWEALVRGLHSSNSATRAGARRAIVSLLDAWRILPLDESAPRVHRLARLLAKNLSDSDSESVQVSADLAERLLAWPSGTGQGLEVVYDCERIFRAAQRVGWPRAALAEPAPKPPVVTAQIHQPPSEPTPVPAHANSTAEESPDETALPQTNSGGATPEKISSAQAEVKSLGLLPDMPPVTPTSESGQLPLDPLAEPLAEKSPAPPPDWPTLATDQVLLRWRDPAFTTEAETELRRRGLNEMNLRVARVAADADPEKRLQLIRLLPQLSHVNAVDWLLVMARDESTRVRAAAVQMLSTTSDPRIHRELQRMEENEMDAGVRATMRKSGTLAR